ncbi:MAG: preprotein translocase subunit SecG [Gammaproteobacteria bacterium]|nr:preprotein translocase subunit SecG [Gammaproteobacteria bacterium]
MLEGLVLVIHILMACLIVILVLLQPGQGAHVGAGGGAGAGSLFGSRGAGSFLTRMTTVFAIVFFATSLVLAHLNAKAVKNGSGVGTVKEEISGPNPEIPNTPNRKDIPTL